MTEGEKATLQALAERANPAPRQTLYPAKMSEVVARLEENDFLVARTHVARNARDVPTWIELLVPGNELLSEHNRLKGLLRAWGIKDPWSFGVVASGLGYITVHNVDDRALEAADAAGKEEVCQP